MILKWALALATKLFAIFWTVEKQKIQEKKDTAAVNKNAEIVKTGTQDEIVKDTEGMLNG